MLRLRPYKRCDAQYIVKWIKDETAFRQWSADRYDNYPVTADDINNHYKAVEDNDSFYEFTAFDESGIVGHLIMRFTDKEKTVLRFGFIIIDNTKRGNGLGKELLNLSLKYAFDILKVKKVTLGVFENNKTAYYCYKAVGFKDVEMPEHEYYSILGEKWKCIELEYTK